MRKKSVKLYDFNFTFDYGTNREGMLNHFNRFVYPIFNSGIEREYGSSTYRFTSIRLFKIDGRLLLAGALINNKELHDEFDIDNNNELVIKRNPETIKHLALSWFGIYLDNHRMFYCQNSSESPKIETFETTIKYILKQLLKQYEDFPFQSFDLSINPITDSKYTEALINQTDYIKESTIVINHPNRNIKKKYDVLEKIKERTAECNIEKSTLKDTNVANVKPYIEELFNNDGSVNKWTLKIRDKSGNTLTVCESKYLETIQVLLNKLSVDGNFQQIILSIQDNETLNSSYEKDVESKLQEIAKQYIDNIIEVDFTNKTNETK